VLSVTVRRTGGHTEYQCINLPETEGIIATGGYAADKRWKVRKNPPVREKLQLSWPEGGLRGGTLGDDEKLIEYANALGISHRFYRRRWISGRLTEADDILRRHWAAVEELVPSLLAQDRLSGDAVTLMWESYSAKARTTTETDRAVENSDKTDN